MICDAASLKKYIDKSPKIFFVFGPEIILKNNSVDLLNQFHKENGFTEKKTIFEKDFKNIEEIINNLRSMYQVLKDEKDCKKIVYDEKLVRERKKLIKSNKEMSYLEYVKNKQKWQKK